jgi:hypothetical protein
MSRGRPETASSKGRRASLRPIDPALNRPANAEESVPEALIPDVVRTDLQQSRVESVDREGRIARRAYELAAARGFEPGHELEDWLQAEKEIDAGPVKQAPPEQQFTG